MCTEKTQSRKKIEHFFPMILCFLTVLLFCGFDSHFSSAQYNALDNDTRPQRNGMDECYSVKLGEYGFQIPTYWVENKSQEKLFLAYAETGDKAVMLQLEQSQLQSVITDTSDLDKEGERLRIVAPFIENLAKGGGISNSECKLLSNEVVETSVVKGILISYKFTLSGHPGIGWGMFLFSEGLDQFASAVLFCTDNAEYRYDDDFRKIVEQVSVGDKLPEPMAAPNPVITPKPITSNAQHFSLYLDIQSTDNIVLNKYDVELYVDDVFIGKIKNGEYYTQLIEVEEGLHIVAVYKSSNHDICAREEINVCGNTTFQAQIDHGKEIGLRNVNIVDNIDGASLEVADTREMLLSTAIEHLNEIGFNNISYEPDNALWNDEWLVVSQNIKAGSHTDKNAPIKLTCEKVSDYYNNKLGGSTLKQLLALGDEFAYDMRYHRSDETSSDMTDYVDRLSEQLKDNWIVTKVEQANYSPKCLVITITYLDNTWNPRSEYNFTQFFTHKTKNSATYYCMDLENMLLVRVSKGHSTIYENHAHATAEALCGDLETGLHVVNSNGTISGGYYLVVDNTLAWFNEDGTRKSDEFNKKTRTSDSSALQLLDESSFYLFHPTPELAK